MFISLSIVLSLVGAAPHLSAQAKNIHRLIQFSVPDIGVQVTPERAGIDTNLISKISEEVSVSIDTRYPITMLSNEYYLKHRDICNQEIPRVGPFVVHVARFFDGKKTTEWFAHIADYRFEYFEETNLGVRYSLWINTLDEANNKHELLQRRFHFMAEGVRRGYAMKIDKKWIQLGSILDEAPVFKNIPRARPEWKGLTAPAFEPSEGKMVWVPNLGSSNCGTNLPGLTR